MISKLRAYYISIAVFVIGACLSLSGFGEVSFSLFEGVLSVFETNVELTSPRVMFTFLALVCLIVQTQMRYYYFFVVTCLVFLVSNELVSIVFLLIQVMGVRDKKSLQGAIYLSILYFCLLLLLPVVYFEVASLLVILFLVSSASVTNVLKIFLMMTLYLNLEIYQPLSFIVPLFLGIMIFKNVFFGESTQNLYVLATAVLFFELQPAVIYVITGAAILCNSKMSNYIAKDSGLYLVYVLCLYLLRDNLSAALLPAMLAMLHFLKDCKLERGESYAS